MLICPTANHGRTHPEVAVLRRIGLQSTMLSCGQVAKATVNAVRSYKQCNVVCMASTPRMKGTKHHTRTRPIKVSGLRAPATQSWL